MWTFLIVFTICMSGLVGMKMSFKQDHKIQKMVEEGKTNRKMIEATATELREITKPVRSIDQDYWR